MVDPTLTFEPLNGDDDIFQKVTSVCIGTGRFLRAMLVPALSEVGGETILAQTRGSSFSQYMYGRLPERSYEVDTVLQDGRVLTSLFPIAACGSLGKPEGRSAFMKLPERLPNLMYIGLGLTEAGIEHNGRSILDLAEFLYACFESPSRGHTLCVLNTDNVPFNGDAIRSYVCSCDFTQNIERSTEFETWLKKHVCFHNTMVDRITSQREGCPDVPRAEPLPSKALVIEDLQNALPQFNSVPGVVVRTQPGQLAQDIALKLRIANGIHTAMVYAMALEALFKTDQCIGHPHVLPYLEQLFERDISHCCAELKLPRVAVTPVFSEWMARIQHPHFGLECFFVCQNASQKMGIRLLPSIKATLANGETPSDFMIFAVAVILRFLTPIGDQPRVGETPPVFVGRLDVAGGSSVEDFGYVSGLNVRKSDGSYEFRDGDGIVPLLLRPLGRPGSCSTTAANFLAGEVLSRMEGFDFRGNQAHHLIAERVGAMLKRMLSGETALTLLAALNPKQPLVLEERHLAEAVQQEVEAAEAIDVHTHLFPTSHGNGLMQYGIDAMLTYHYLVSEYLASSREAPEEFYALSTTEQADRVWQGLFVESTPMSEPCRGVLTTLSALGLQKEVAQRDLTALRRWYAGQDAVMFNEKMMRLARLRYIVTSHDPFDAHQLHLCLEPPPEMPRYKSALALDALLEGRWEEVTRTLENCGKPKTLRGAYELASDCVRALQPVFITCGTPENFTYCRGVVRPPSEDILDTDLSASVFVPSPQQVLDAVLLPLCREFSLALSLRMGMRRAVNPTLQLAGDAVGCAELRSLGHLCEANPMVKFLFTVLSRNDQHEAAVLSSKFRNLHLWGCWWYCNKPSVIMETTSLRLEMLGMNFTYQASSARVHDQLIYKWIHSRALLSKLLVNKYTDLMATGWQVSRGDIRRDVHRLLGGAFQDFLEKPL